MHDKAKHFPYCIPRIVPADSVRIDKWLWAVRVYKTRTLAAEACKSGKVKVDGTAIKPSYDLKTGITVQVQKEGHKKILKALQLIEKRVGADIAATCYEDLSPPPPPKSPKEEAFFYTFEVRERGSGRPTKRERRTIDKFKSKDA